MADDGHGLVSRSAGACLLLRNLAERKKRRDASNIPLPFITGLSRAHNSRGIWPLAALFENAEEKKVSDLYHDLTRDSLWIS
jgi:hypothetical protein